MKILAAAIVLTVLPLAPINGQTSPYQLAGVRRIEKFERFGDKPAVEIKVSGPIRVGGLFNCLQVGTLNIHEGGFVSNESAILFYVSMKDWKKLKNKSPMWISWGCYSQSLLASIEPMAYLDKKMLDRPSAVKSPSH